YAIARTPRPASRTASVAFQPAPMSGRETPPRTRATENIGPIASACATAWMVVRFFVPSAADALAESDSLISSRLRSRRCQRCRCAPERADDIRFEHRMSTTATSSADSDEAPRARALRVRSVVGLAYDEIRMMIVDGPLAPGARLGQGELADQLGISRG